MTVFWFNLSSLVVFIRKNTHYFSLQNLNQIILSCIINKEFKKK